MACGRGKRMLPRHIGIIPDGNRRWAKRNGVGLFEAYKRGYERLVEIVKYINSLGINYISVYGLSYDNCLRRPPEEREVIGQIAVMALQDIRRDETLRERGIRVSIIGEPSIFGESLAREARLTVDSTHDRWSGVLTIAICYSGRWEMERYCSRGMIPPSLLLPPIDLLIRTGGMRRLSGFMPLALEYAELYFTETLWPDISVEEVDRAIQWFSRQPRNFGR